MRVFTEGVWILSSLLFIFALAYLVLTGLILVAIESSVQF